MGHFHLALWHKTFAESRWLLVASCLLMLVFHALFVWMTGLIDLSMLRMFLTTGIKLDVANLFPVPIETVTTPGGMICLAYVHPLVLLTLTVWGIARGSDVVSGELDRGTLEFILAQPIRRLEVLWAHLVLDTLGVVVIALACWAGTCLGIVLMELELSVTAYLLPATNLAALGFCLGGLASMISSWHRYRWRTIAWMGGLFAVQLLMKVVAQTDPRMSWLAYFTLFGAFEPELFVGLTKEKLLLSLPYNGVLLALGAAAYAIAGVVLSRRDLPAPL